MVGQIHEDIDQFFSIISTWLKRWGKWLKRWEIICHDFHSLKVEILKYFSSKQRNLTFTNMILFYIPHLNEKLTYHSIPHQFKFQTFEGTVLCHYQVWSTHANWLPSDLSASSAKLSEPQAQSILKMNKRKYVRMHPNVT